MEGPGNISILNLHQDIKIYRLLSYNLDIVIKGYGISAVFTLF